MLTLTLLKCGNAGYSYNSLELWIAELYDFSPLEPQQVYLSALGTAVETLLSGGTSVNPLSNLRLGSGIAPILKYLQAGMNVSFGCDGSASNDSQDLLEASKIGSILHNVTDRDDRHWITPRQSVEMSSLGGAKGLNMANELGSLTVEKKSGLGTL